MAAHQPEQLYVRCAEKPVYAGVYIKDSSRIVNEWPVWAKADGSMFLYCAVNKKWRFTHTFDHVATNKGRVSSTKQENGEGPWQVEHGDWSYAHGSEHEILAGTLVRSSPDAMSHDLPDWAEQLGNLRQSSDTWVYVNSRAPFLASIDKLGSNMCSAARGYKATVASGERKHQELQRAKDKCIDACMKACFPDVELVVGSQSIWTNEEVLVSASPFFKAMFSDETKMVEAATRCVKLPTADASVVRSLLCLIYTSGSALPKMNAPLQLLIEMWGQAMEWQCDAVGNSLMLHLCRRIPSADPEAAARALKIVAMHAASVESKHMRLLLGVAVERFAETRAGEFSELEDLSADTLKQILASDRLDTSDDEARVLALAVRWAKKHGTDSLPELLRLVRFPLVPLGALSEEAKQALGFAKEHAPQVLQRLIGEATELQLEQHKNARRQREGAEQDPEEAKRARKRMRSSGIPGLTYEALGEVLCGSIFATPT